MNKQNYSLYDFPELLYNSKLLTNRQRCIVLCLFFFLNLRGGGAFSIDILAEKTGIKKNHIYEEIKNLFVITPNGEKVRIIKRDGKKVLLIVENLRKFIDTKLGLTESPKSGLRESQNGTKEVPKQDLESPNIGLKKSQNGTKKSPKNQGTQEPDGCVNNISRIEGDNNRPAEKSEPDFGEEKREVDREDKKEIPESLFTRVVEEIKAKFKLCYKERFNRYPIIDGRSTERVIKTLKDSANTTEELSDICPRLIEKIPEFFKKNDPWLRKKGYSWFAFSWRIGDLLNEPVKEQLIQHSKEFGSKEVAIW